MSAKVSHMSMSSSTMTILPMRSSLFCNVCCNACMILPLYDRFEFAYKRGRVERFCKVGMKTGLDGLFCQFRRVVGCDGDTRYIPQPGIGLEPIEQAPTVQAG